MVSEQKWPTPEDYSDYVPPAVTSYPIDPEFRGPNARKMLWEDLREPWQSKPMNLVCYTFSCIKYMLISRRL